MTYEEFQRHIGKAGLKLVEFASLMDLSPVTISNYRKGGSVPRHLSTIAVLLGEMAERGIDFRAIFAANDIAPKKARRLGSRKFGGYKQ
jgi:transcriptional regulator with XRE-family HTH domain